MKKMSGGIIIFYKCTKNHDYMLGLSFWFFKKMEKMLEVLSFHASLPKDMIIWYIVPGICHGTNVVVIFILGYFYHFTTLTAQKMKIKKKQKKTPGDIIILRKYTKNYNYMMYRSWDMVCDRYPGWERDRKSDKNKCLRKFQW